MLKTFSGNFFNSKLNLLVNFNEKGITDICYIEKGIWKWFDNILASFLHWITIDKTEIIQERIDLLVWNFKETCETNFYMLRRVETPYVCLNLFLLRIFSRGIGRERDLTHPSPLPPPWRIGWSSLGIKTALSYTSFVGPILF